ncbi:hypothetical protein IC582_028384 [Cucumis melo]
MFERLEEHNPIVICQRMIFLTAEDWYNSRVFVKFLKSFSEVMMKFSAPMSVTSNIFFHEFCLVQ